MNGWAALSSRDRQALSIGGVLLLATLFYLFAWEPLAARESQLVERITVQRQQLDWMRQAVGSRPAGAGRAAGGSLLSTVDQTAGANGLKSAIKRVAPEGSGQVRVWLGEAPYHATIRWIETLHRQGIPLQAIQLERHQAPGRVDARLLLGQAS